MRVVNATTALVLPLVLVLSAGLYAYMTDRDEGVPNFGRDLQGEALARVRLMIHNAAAVNHARPYDEVARTLGGARTTSVVDALSVANALQVKDAFLEGLEPMAIKYYGEVIDAAKDVAGIQKMLLALGDALTAPGDPDIKNYFKTFALGVLDTYNRAENAKDAYKMAWDGGAFFADEPYQPRALGKWNRYVSDVASIAEECETFSAAIPEKFGKAIADFKDGISEVHLELHGELTPFTRSALDNFQAHGERPFFFESFESGRKLPSAWAKRINDSGDKVKDAFLEGLEPMAIKYYGEVIDAAKTVAGIQKMLLALGDALTAPGDPDIKGSFWQRVTRFSQPEPEPEPDIKDYFKIFALGVLDTYSRAENAKHAYEMAWAGSGFVADEPDEPRALGEWRRYVTDVATIAEKCERFSAAIPEKFGKAFADFKDGISEVHLELHDELTPFTLIALEKFTAHDKSGFFMTSFFAGQDSPSAWDKRINDSGDKDLE